MTLPVGRLARNAAGFLGRGGAREGTRQQGQQQTPGPGSRAAAAGRDMGPRLGENPLVRPGRARGSGRRHEC